MAFEDLKPTTPTFRLGKRRFALEHREFKGKQQLGLVEVTAKPDAADPLRIGGWQPVFKGLRIQGTDEEFTAFIKAVNLVLTSKTSSKV